MFRPTNFRPHFEASPQFSIAAHGEYRSPCRPSALGGYCAANALAWSSVQESSPPLDQGRMVGRPAFPPRNPLGTPGESAYR